MTPIKFCKPFINCTPSNMTQGFIKGIHEANDFTSSFGTFLLAPFDCKIVRIVQATKLDQSTNEMQSGCGLLMTSLGDPNWRVAFWHCIPVFPVNVGDIVNQGTPVAQMGNTGFVQGWDGKELIIYTVEEREQEALNSTPTNLPKKGVHVHISCGYGDGTAENTVNQDFHNFIDWTIQPKVNFLQSIQNILLKISNLLK